MSTPIAAADPVAPANWALWTIRLLWVSVVQGALPVGCGAGSGCADVLVSPWSRVLGIPVSAGALAVYAGVLAGSFLVTRTAGTTAQRIGWQLLVVLAAVLAFSAIYFIGLQLVVIRAICPWCMTDHALGLILAAIILWQLPRRTPASQSADSEPGRFSPARILFLGLVGSLLVSALVGLQMAFPSKVGNVVMLPAGENADSGPGPDRTIQVLDGSLVVQPHEVPVLGSADAPTLLAILFDYCCPHCRAAHGYLAEGLDRFEGKFAVVMLPMPLNADCNPAWEETEPRFKDSCQLARLALAVHIAEPEKFPEFDAWLFEPEMPRGADEARAEAERLVTAEKLEAALADPRIDARIAADTAAFGRLQKTNPDAAALPIIMSPGFSTLVGRHESAEELFESLKQAGLSLESESPAEADSAAK